MIGLLPEIISLLIAAPQLVNSAGKVWSSIMTLHAVGAIIIPADQLAKLQAMDMTLDADIAAMLAAKPVL